MTNTKSHLIQNTLFAVFLSLFLFTSNASAKRRTRVELETNKGTIVLALYNETPIHKDNFIKKVEEGFFNGKTFNRVIRNFMIQCGEEQVERNLKAEILYPKYYHKRGALAMGRSGDDVEKKMETNAEQFYIVWGEVANEEKLNRADSIMYRWSYGKHHMTKKMRKYYAENPGTPHLDGSFTVFGEVIKGLDIVGEIQMSETDKNDRPLEDVVIIQAKLTR